MFREKFWCSAIAHAIFFNISPVSLQLKDLCDPAY